MTRGSYARACIKASQFIDLNCIAQELKADCHIGKVPHHCFDMFRDHLSIVRNFRILWASLTRVQRTEYIYKLIRETC